MMVILETEAEEQAILQGTININNLVNAIRINNLSPILHVAIKTE